MPGSKETQHRVAGSKEAGEQLGSKGTQCRALGSNKERDLILGSRELVAYKSTLGSREAQHRTPGSKEKRQRTPSSKNNVTHFTLTSGQLLTRQYAPGLDALPSCTICLEDFLARESVHVLPCDTDHIFHPSCLGQWFARNGRRVCPICREERTLQLEGTEPHAREQEDARRSTTQQQGAGRNAGQQGNTGRNTQQQDMGRNNRQHGDSGQNPQEQGDIGQNARGARENPQPQERGDPVYLNVRTAHAGMPLGSMLSRPVQYVWRILLPES